MFTFPHQAWGTVKMWRDWKQGERPAGHKGSFVISVSQEHTEEDLLLAVRSWGTEDYTVQWLPASSLYKLCLGEDLQAEGSSRSTLYERGTRTVWWKCWTNLKSNIDLKFCKIDKANTWFGVFFTKASSSAYRLLAQNTYKQKTDPWKNTKYILFGFRVSPEQQQNS